MIKMPGFIQRPKNTIRGKNCFSGFNINMKQQLFMKYQHKNVSNDKKLFVSEKKLIHLT